jgi:hypothetical protein
MSTGDLRELLRAAEDDVREGWGAAPAATIVGVPESSDVTSRIDESQASAALDRLTQLGLAMLDHEKLGGFDLVIETLVRLYRDAGTEVPLLGSPDAKGLVQADRWFAIIERVYVLGAAARGIGDFAAVRSAVAQQPLDERGGRRYWIRDTVTALGRQDRFKRRSLLGPIIEFTSEREVFFRRFSRRTEELVRQLCQFDFLQCVIAIADTNDIRACYPNFGPYGNERVEPIVLDLFHGGPSRRVVPDLTRPQISHIVDQLDELVFHEHFDLSSWAVHGWSDKALLQDLATDRYMRE